MAFAASASAADSVYWSNDSGNSLGRAALDGSGGSTITPAPVTPAEPYGTAIDAATGRIYWADAGTNRILFSNLDGSGAGVVDTTGAEVNGPEGLGIDPAAGRIYWANLNTDTIGWASLDGGGGGLLDTGEAPIEEPDGLAVDPALGRVYWASYGDSLIGWANLSGDGVGGELELTEAQEDETLNGPGGLAIDAATDRIYWTNWFEEDIAWASLDGAFAGVLSTGAFVPEDPAGLAIDPDAERLYWANESGSIASVPLAGGEATGLDLTGASPAEPSFPVLLQAPAASSAPSTAAASVEVGATMTCGAVDWRADLPESFLYRAPQSTAYRWTRDGAPIVGVDGPTLVAAEGGDYDCQASATNGAGTTAVEAGRFTVSSPEEPRFEAPGGRAEGVSPTQPPSASAPAPPAVTVARVAKVRFDRRHGFATLVVQVAGPGTLKLSGKGIARRRLVAAGATTLRVPVRASGSVLGRLIDKGRATVSPIVTFTAAEGTVTTTKRTITLVRNLTGTAPEHHAHGKR